MYRRERPPDRAGTRSAPHAPAPGLPSGLGNQAMIRLLRPALAREPAPSRLKTEPVTDLYTGGTSAEQWGDQLRGGESVIPLYTEIAKLAGVSKLDGFGTDINRALRRDPGELKPGLNFVARFGPRGETGYLVDGEYTGKLPTTRTGSEPKVVILLGPLAFDAGNKAAALGVLRHEVEHAFHDQLAAKALARWRADATAEKIPFAGWLERQSMSAVDRSLIRERITGDKPNTEALAHLEGFIAGFPVEAPDVKPGAHPVYENELKEAAQHWTASDKAVKAELIARLKAFKGRLKGERLTTLVADLKDLKAGDKAYAPLVDGVL